MINSSFVKYNVVLQLPFMHIFIFFYPIQFSESNLTRKFDFVTLAPSPDTQAVSL